MKRMIPGVGVVLLAAACGGQAGEEPADPGAEQMGRAAVPNQGRHDTAAPPKSGGVDDVEVQGLDACGVAGEVVAVRTAAEVLDRMVGRWLYCSGFEIFGQRHDGIELKADGSWAFLRYDGAGALQPQRGFDGGGSWTMIDTQSWNGPGSFQVNFDTSYGSNPSRMSFQQHPTAMRLSTTGGLTDYVASP